MPNPQILSLGDALALAPETKKRHVLLGNGFSRAWQDDVFSYSALLEQASFEQLSPFARRSFDALSTTDFEDVMKALRSAAALIRLYDEASLDLPRRLLEDAAGLKEVMVQAIAGRHPIRPHAVIEEEYRHAKTFLANFHDFYTLNYDLLLYWALMQQEIEPQIRFDDRFRTPDGDGYDYVTWEVERPDRQNVFYLHGALHIFDGGYEIQKYTWANTGIPLLEQIRAALEKNLYPLFVSEGESKHKLEKIKHSDFLGRSYRSFAKIGGALFVYGLSMGASDEHVLPLIEKNRCSKLFVSLYGSPDSPSNRQIRERSHAIAAARPSTRILQVKFFDAASAKVWRD
jgi:Domain of unknown function (DUF4917)